MESYKTPFDFNKFYTLQNIDEVSGWDGYIDTEGNFYITKPNSIDYWMGSFNLHADFADDYLTIVKGIDSISSVIREEIKSGKIKDDCLYGAKDYLVHVLGWVSIGHSNITDEVYTCVPSEEYCGLKPTEIQKQVALKLYEINSYDMRDYFYKFDGIMPEYTEEDIKRLNRMYGIEDEEVEVVEDDFLSGE